MYAYDFTVTGSLEIQESLTDSIKLRGTFLKLNHKTRNGRVYQIEEGESIAQKMLGLPVYFGNHPDSNRHLKGIKYKVGKVIEAVFDRIKGIIHGVVEIVNTQTYPNLLDKVRAGFGFSIGGKARDLIGGAIKRVIGMLPTHLQLMNPTTLRGQTEAKVEDIQESYSEYQFEIEESVGDEGYEDLTKLAQIAFTREKELFLSEAKKHGVSSDRLDEMARGITDPDDLLRTREMFDLIRGGMLQGLKTEYKRPDPQNPPQGSQVSLKPETYRSYSRYAGNTPEVISRLYQDSQSSNPEMRQYASDLLDKLWKKAWYQLKEKMDKGEPLIGVELISCPNSSCNRAIPRKSTTCPFCGFPIEQQRVRGLDV